MHRLSQIFRFTSTWARLLPLSVAAMVIGCLVLLGRTEANSISYKGITLTPAVVNVTLLKDQSASKFSIGITNNTTIPQTLQVSTLDFRSLNETGGIAFLGNTAKQLTYKYRLASWISFDKTPIELAPHATKEIAVTIENRADLAPGGHYAAVLFKANSGTANSGTNPVAINQVVSTLVFVSKTDGAQYGIKLARTSVGGSWLSMPGTANLVFQNTGDIQIVPRGIVAVTSPFSHEVSRGIINVDSNLMLPDSRRLYQVKLTPVGAFKWPGRYHVTVQYRYDGSTTIQQATTTFVYIGPLWIGAGIIAVLGMWYAVYERRAIRRFFRQRSRQKRSSK